MKKIERACKNQTLKKQPQKWSMESFFQMMNNVAILKDAYKIMSMCLVEEK